MDIIIILFDGLVTSFTLTLILYFISTKILYFKLRKKNQENKTKQIDKTVKKMNEFKERRLFKIVNMYKDIVDIPYEEMDKDDKFRFLLSRAKYWFTFLAICNVIELILYGLLLKYGSAEIIDKLNNVESNFSTYRQSISGIIYGNAILVIFNCIVSIGITIKQSMDVYDDKLGSMMIDCIEDYLITKLDEEETNGILKFAGVVMVNCIDEDIGNKLIDSMAKVKYSSPEVGEKILKTIVNELEKDEKKLRMLKPNGQEALAKLKKII